jgi:hypothetical protein
MSRASKNTLPPPVERDRAAQVILYDLQGGPIPKEALDTLVESVEKIAKSYSGLAITVVQE